MWHWTENGIDLHIFKFEGGVIKHSFYIQECIEPFFLNFIYQALLILVRVTNEGKI